MQPTMTPDEFNQALAELKTINDYRLKRRGRWWPRKTSNIYWFWMMYLIAFGIGSLIVPTDRFQVLLFALLAFLFRHTTELYRSRGDDILLNSRIMMHLQQTLLRETEALTQANNYLRNQLAERDS